jgi:hypothetical protein
MRVLKAVSVLVAAVLTLAAGIRPGAAKLDTTIPSARSRAIVPKHRHETRPADDARQHARAGRHSPDRLLPQRYVSASGDHRRVEVSGRRRGAVVPDAHQVRQVRSARSLCEAQNGVSCV